MPKTVNPRIAKTEDRFDSAVPWLATQAEVTDCHYEFARMNTLTLGIAPDSYRFLISFTYYAHAKTFSGKFTSPVAMPTGGTFPSPTTRLNLRNTGEPNRAPPDQD